MNHDENKQKILDMISFVGNKLNEVYKDLPGSIAPKADKVLCEMASFTSCSMTDEDVKESRETLKEMAHDLGGISFRVAFQDRFLK